LARALPPNFPRAAAARFFFAMLPSYTFAWRYAIYFANSLDICVTLRILSRPWTGRVSVRRTHPALTSSPNQEANAAVATDVKVSSNRNESCGNRRTIRRTIPRSTTCGNPNK
jgi:hypothetical protein